MNTTPKMPKTLTTEDFKAIAEFCYRAVEAARKALPATDILPPCVLFGSIEEGKLVIYDKFCPPLEDDHDKRMLLLFMETLVQHPDIDFAVFIAESWMLADSEDHDFTESIADHPQRQEAVVFNILSKECQAIVANPLYRDPLRLERGEIITTIAGKMVRPKPPTH
jgi:hypothetical protein